MRRILLSLAALLFAVVAGHAVPMKARVIQPLFAQDHAGLDKSFEWTLRELERCDASLDIVVLPEFSEVPGKTSYEGFLETVRQYGPTLLDACARTARRCSTLVFVGAIDTSWDVPKARRSRSTRTQRYMYLATSRSKSPLIIPYSNPSTCRSRMATP